MYLRAKTLDDLLRGVFKKLLKSKNYVTSSRGDSWEEYGVLLQLNNPTARLSLTEKKGTLFSCLGELLWYLAGSKELEFISYYIPAYIEESEDDKTIFGGYGPRLFNMRGNDQIKNILNLLNNKPQSRRAVIQLFNAEDIAQEHKEIPCTCALQFVIRENRLHMFTSMRSNDAYIGLPHDIFTFTMLQEILARTLNLQLGKYKHAVGSLHLYTKNIAGAEQFLDEGLQDMISMPMMPTGDPWPSIKLLLKAESIIRNGDRLDIDTFKLDQYWKDLARLLQIYRHLKDGKLKNVVRVKNAMSTSVYENYIRKKLSSKSEQDFIHEQLEIPAE